MYNFANFVDGKSRKAGHNRRVLHRTLPDGERQIVYTLHGHEVASLTETDEGYTLELDNCGYPTMTTSSAMREFLDQTDIWNSCGHSHFGIVTFDRRIEIPLNHHMEPKPVYDNIKLDDTKLTYTTWGHHTRPYEHVSGWVYHIGHVPEPIRPMLKGYFTCGYDTYKWITRARKSSVRETRLMAKVLTGEAMLHEW